ncbi:MAG: glycoside hydrolase family 32 protein [Candidatus Hydrogenedentota bacterium]
MSDRALLRFLLSVCLLLALISPADAATDAAAFDAIHAQAIEKANASVAEAIEQAQADPHYPIYHLRPPAYWINDPNGPVYFDGKYHMFFQHNPYGDKWGNMSWAHAVSEDLVHWEHWPIALTPNPDSYDKGGIFSGCCVVHDGVPTILYTGVSPQVQAIATSTDGMRTWTKHPANPVVADPPLEDLEGFRDPYAWQEDGVWYILIGGGIRGEGGAALLYRSEDLVDWEYLHPLCVGFAKNWECPNFFPLGDKHVLVVSPHGDVRYAFGDYDKKSHTFAPGEWHRLDIAEGGPFYAPNSMFAPDGRLLLWGWIRGAGGEGYPWNGCLTLPRVLTRRDDGRLGIEPAAELAALRQDHFGAQDIVLDGRRPERIDAEGDAIEILLDIDVGNAEAVGIEVRQKRLGADAVRIEYDNIAHRLSAGEHSGDFQVLPGEDELKLHVFLDKSVIEVYANGRAALTTRIYPDENAQGIALYSKGRPATVRSVDVWNLGSIWPADDDHKETAP